MEFIIYDYIGFIGFLVLFYVLTKINITKNYYDKKEFYILNIIGSFLLIFNDIYKESWFALGIGVFWISISIITLRNKLILPIKYLWIIIILALLFFGFGLIRELFKMYTEEGDIYNVFGMFSTGLTVIIYGMLASKKLSLFFYLIIGIFAKIIMISALYYDFNYASLSLQIYSILIAFIGIYRIIYIKN